jgi:hypothetical protein
MNQLTKFKYIYFDGSNGWCNGGIYNSQILHDEGGIRYITIAHEDDDHPDTPMMCTYHDSNGEGIFIDKESEGDEMYIEMED